MGIYAIKVPDVGEGVAEAELIEWHVKPGDLVREDDIIAAVMTDKATVEIPSSVNGTVQWLGAEVGDTVAIGSELIHLEVDGPGNHSEPSKSGSDKAPTERQRSAFAETEEQTAALQAEKPVETTDEPVKPTPAPEAARLSSAPGGGAPARNAGGRPIAAPAVRKAARDAGIDLRLVRGTGPAGRITHDDLIAFQNGGEAEASVVSLRRKTAVEDIKVTGLRRKISENMAEANIRVPHITIVEELDVTALEELRTQLNREHEKDRGKLTVLPFVMRAIVRAVADQPTLNAHYLDDEGISRLFAGVHIGIATQTPMGLMVPVVQHAEARGLWDAAAEISRLAEVARNGKANRDELSGSTISITSLGPLGALAATPIINRPEVAIVGINKIAIRPVWQNGQFVPRQMMNISCSFDHRVIDGWDAAVFVQKLKSQLETPALMFVEGP